MCGNFFIAKKVDLHQHQARQICCSMKLLSMKLCGNDYQAGRLKKKKISK